MAVWSLNHWTAKEILQVTSAPLPCAFIAPVQWELSASLGNYTFSKLNMPLPGSVVSAPRVFLSCQLSASFCLGSPFSSDIPHLTLSTGFALNPLADTLDCHCTEKNSHQCECF